MNNFEAMPRLRIEVEGIKAGIVSSLGMMNSEVGEYIAKQIELSVQCYDFENEVKRVVHDQIDKTIKNYFSDGEGKTAIKEAVDEGFRSATGKDNT